jgi:intein/homing endonuclease
MTTRMIDGKLIKFSKVLKVAPVGTRHVYDIEVRDTHNYFANGVNVHNCEFHTMLTEYGAKYGTEFFRMKDIYLKYFHKNIELYPAGPSKRALRGRTRFLCLTGDSLVNTNRGLIPIRDKRLIGHTTFAGTSPREIIGHVFNGYRQTFDLTLDNGLALSGTEDHKVAVYAQGRLAWKEIQDLTLDDYVVCSVGGSFPDSLPLTLAKPKRQESRIEKVVKFLQKNTSFTIDDLFYKIRNFSNRNAVTAVTSRLVREGYVVKKKRSAADGIFDFYKTSKDIEKFLPKRRGKICRLRDKIVYPAEMTVDLAKVLGYLVADGSYSLAANTEISFGTTSFEKFNDFLHCFKTVFGFTPRHKEGRILPSGQRAYGARNGLDLLKDFLVYLGLDPKNSATKSVPWSIFEAPRKAVVAFLSSAISCDGDVGHTVGYNSLSKQLCLDMQLLFFKLGYPCHVRTEGPRMWRLILKPYTASLFRKEYIGKDKRTIELLSRFAR